MNRETLIEIFERVLESDAVTDLELDLHEEEAGVRISFSIYPTGRNELDRDFCEPYGQMYLVCNSDWDEFYYKNEPLLKSFLEFRPNEDGAKSFKYDVEFNTFERLAKIFRDKVISMEEKEAKEALPADEESLLLMAEEFGIKSLPIKRKVIIEKAKRKRKGEDDE